MRMYLIYWNFQRKLQVFSPNMLEGMDYNQDEIKLYLSQNPDKNKIHHGNFIGKKKQKKH